MFILGILCRTVGIVSFEHGQRTAAGSAVRDPRWVDVGRWAEWARIELARGTSHALVESKLIDELAPLVGSTGSEGVAHEVMALACASDEHADGRSSPQVARRMAF
jgi:hypothetical protein